MLFGYHCDCVASGEAVIMRLLGTAVIALTDGVLKLG
jgi:hypothetical protein